MKCTCKPSEHLDENWSPFRIYNIRCPLHGDFEIITIKSVNHRAHTAIQKENNQLFNQLEALIT